MSIDVAPKKKISMLYSLQNLPRVNLEMTGRTGRRRKGTSEIGGRGQSQAVASTCMVSMYSSSLEMLNLIPTRGITELGA